MAMSSSWNRRLAERIKSMRRDSPRFDTEYQAEINAHRRSLFERLVIGIVAGLGLVMLLIGLPVGIAFGLSSDPQIEMTIAVLGIVSTLASFFMAEFLLSQLLKSNELSVCSHLPVSDLSIVRRIWRTMFLASLIGLWFLLAVGFGIFAPLSNTFAQMGLAILFALVQWGFILGLGTALACWLPRFPHGVTAILMVIIGVGGAVFGNSEIHQLLMWSGWLSPGGWVGDAAWQGILQQNQMAYLAAIPAVLVAVFVPRMLTNFAKTFHINEFLIRQGQELRSIFAGAFTGAEAGRMVPHLSSDDEAPPEHSEETVREQWRNLDDSSGWTKRGWQERLVAGWLTPRERHLVTYLTGDLLSWSSSWNSSVKILLILGAILASGLWPFQMSILYLILYFTAIFLFVGFLQDSNPGLYMTKCSGAYVAHFANYPLGTGELSRIFLKLSLLKTCFLGLIAVPMIVFLGWLELRYGYTAAAWFVVGMLSFSFWRLSFLLSGGFAMPRLKISTLWIPILLVVLFMATISSAIIGLKIPADLIPALVVCAGSSIANWWLFKWLVDHGRTDLVAGSESVLGNQFWDGILKGQQQIEQQKRKQTQLKKQLGTFWWLRRPFG